MNSQSTYSQLTNVRQIDRWVIYNRLKELHISCRCEPNTPLQVEINSPAAAIQLWSVIRQTTEARTELVNWLAVCWKMNCSIND
jgi:hypothetical protein